MGTLQEQLREYEDAKVYIDNLRAADGPYKLSEEQKRQFLALEKQAAHGAFRHAPADQKANLGTREKQTWEALGNITKTEAMRRFTTKTAELKIQVNLAEANAKLLGQ